MNLVWCEADYGAIDRVELLDGKGELAAADEVVVAGVPCRDAGVPGARDVGEWVEDEAVEDCDEGPGEYYG